MNRSAAHTRLVREILAAIGSLPGVIAGDNPCGRARFPRNDDPSRIFSVAFGWPVNEGAPDILVAVDGRLLCIEVKTGAGTTSPEQRQCHEALRQAGVRVVVVRSVEEAVQAVADTRRKAA